MTNDKQTIVTAATHSEIANTAFQVFTIAVAALFSVMALFHAAAQIV